MPHRQMIKPPITMDLSADENQELRRRLDEFNEPFVGKPNPREIGLAVRSDEGELVAGLIGSAVWEMLHINVIWVSDALRGQGYGSKLLTQAEDEGRNLGCEFVKLHTFSFQARPFYERHGYQVIGETRDFPKGHSQFLMFKPLIELQ